MHDRIPPTPPRVGVRHGQAYRPVLPVHIDGDQATLVLDHIPDEPLTRLRLSWDDGSVTELAVRPRAVECEPRIACLEVYGVEGAWRPFLEYIGRG